MRTLRRISLPFVMFAMLVAITLGTPLPSPAQISIGLSVHIGPPVLPVYVQPVCPTEGYIWTPGYWAYGPDGYFWVPGTWVEPPQVGVLWTPGYWGWGGDAYLWHAGYWGPHVGFYGGVNYGFGYVGVGYVGGRWDNGRFAYNTAINNVNVTVIHNTYVDRTVINNNVTVNRVSFNGGNGGINARPTSQEQNAEREQHFQATNNQAQHEQAARGDRNQLASVNRGQPAVAATPRPGAFSGEGVVRARGAGGPSNGGANSFRPPSSGTPGGNHAGGGAPALDSSRPSSGGAATYRPPTAGGNHSSTGAPAANTTRSGNGGPSGESVRTNGQAGGQHNNGGTPPAQPRATAPHSNQSQPGNSHSNNKPQQDEGRGKREER